MRGGPAGFGRELSSYTEPPQQENQNLPSQEPAVGRAVGYILTTTVLVVQDRRTARGDPSSRPSWSCSQWPFSPNLALGYLGRGDPVGPGRGVGWAGQEGRDLLLKQY